MNSLLFFIYVRERTRIMNENYKIIKTVLLGIQNVLARPGTVRGSSRQGVIVI